MYCTGQASYGKTPGAVSVRGVVTGVKGRLQCPLDPCHCLQPYGGATVWEKYQKNNRVSTWGVWCRCWRIFFFFVSVWFGYSFAPRPEPTTGMCSGGSKDPSSKLLPSTGRRTGRWPDARVCCSRSHCRDTQGQMKKTTDSCGVTAKTRSESGGGWGGGSHDVMSWDSDGERESYTASLSWHWGSSHSMWSSSCEPAAVCRCHRQEECCGSGPSKATGPPGATSW